MTDHQRPEALDRAGDAEMLADEGDLIHLQSWQYVQKVLRASAAELRRLHAESIEQARLLGMSAERELALRARVQELGRALKEGKVRAVTDLHAENEALRKANAEAIRLLGIGLRNVANSLDKSIERAYAGKSDSGATVSSLTDAMSAMHLAIMDLTAAAREAQATETRLSGEAK